MVSTLGLNTDYTLKLTGTHWSLPEELHHFVEMYFEGVRKEANLILGEIMGRAVPLRPLGVGSGRPRAMRITPTKMERRGDHVLLTARVATSRGLSEERTFAIDMRNGCGHVTLMDGQM